ncbi:Hypothetical protein FKW44_002812 [Caligus rogercresseyi]|uniref:Uncharacterized protein n=1 Tax=Caligus rogercresseyi TaxID=217165 RepID=A0A7T8QWL0_CALRO|nr:Hypothetical protein FKW44_002812 [Caligus rogercresseyi]
MGKNQKLRLCHNPGPGGSGSGFFPDPGSLGRDADNLFLRSVSRTSHLRTRSAKIFQAFFQLGPNFIFNKRCLRPKHTKHLCRARALLTLKNPCKTQNPLTDANLVLSEFNLTQNHPRVMMHLCTKFQLSSCCSLAVYRSQTDGQTPIIISW